MKSIICRILLILGIIFNSYSVCYAIIDLPSTSYELSVGVDKYLPVPDAYYGYIDHAVWACSQSGITFKQKDAAGAIIQITRKFSGTAIVEVLATEKYYDSLGYTRSETYYKQYLITCTGGSSSEVSEIILPQTISLNLGETKSFKILSGDCYNGAFTITKKECEPSGCVSYSVNYKTGDILLSGMMVGECVLNIETANGDEMDCRIVVSAVGQTSGRRTEKEAILDIKLLTNRVLSLAYKTGINEVFSDDKEIHVKDNNIYNIQGVLLKQNATEEDIRSLKPGVYIVKGRKIVVQKF